MKYLILCFLIFGLFGCNEKQNENIQNLSQPNIIVNNDQNLINENLVLDAKSVLNDYNKNNIIYNDKYIIVEGYITYIDEDKEGILWRTFWLTPNKKGLEKEYLGKDIIICQEPNQNKHVKINEKIKVKIKPKNYIINDSWKNILMNSFCEIL